MEFHDLLFQVGDLPIFSSALLQAGDVDRANLQKQLSRWTAAGKIHQLRRGLYTLAEPYRQKDPHPFLIANRLIAPSYVSLQSALAYYDLIPEAVPQVLSITSKLRSKVIETSLGSFRYHNIQSPLFSGFSLVQVSIDQSAYLARPEKALFDLIYLTKQSHTPEYLDSLRLQNLDQLDMDWMKKTAREFGLKKLVRAVDHLFIIRDREKLSLL
jgi:predicted transcriptional regulator of viral defense system